jgi:GAF domain-containing protein
MNDTAKTQEQLGAELDALRQRQTARVTAAAQVSRAASSNLKVDELLPQVMDLIRASFDLYYTGIFLVDDLHEYALLKAGAGEAGQQMLAAGHKLKIGGASMIGWCVANKQARVALDVSQETVRFDNPYLPKTRSELALPLLSRGQAIGAMTVQSTREMAFNEEDITVLQTMADQIANAIENARLFEETQQRITALSILSEVGQAFSVSLDLDKLVETVYQQVSRVFDTTHFFIATYVEGSNEWTMALQTEFGKRLPPVTRKLGIGLTSHIIQTHQPVLLHTVEENNAFFKKHAITRSGQQSKSWMGVPMIAAGHIVGVIAIQSYEQENSYRKQDIELFSTLAAQAAIAIQNARLFQETQARVTQMSILNEIGQAFAAALNLGELLETVYRQVGRVFETTDFYIATYEEKTGEWVDALNVERGQKQPLARYKIGTGITSHIIQARQPLVWRTIQEGQALLEKHGIQALGEMSKSWMGVPLIASGNVVGAMGIQSYEKENLYSDQDLALFSTIAAQAAIAIHNARLFEEARQRVFELSILNEISQASTAGLKLDELLQAVQRQVHRVFDTTNFYIALYQEGSDEWTSAFQIEHGERQPVVRRKLSVGFTSHIIRTRQPALLHSSKEAEDFAAQHGIPMVGEIAKAWMGVPLLAAGQVVGAMAVQSYAQESLYGAQDLELFTTIAAQAATAIQNARLFEETQQRVTELGILNDIGQAFSAALKLDELLQVVHQQVSRVFDTTNFFIATYQEGAAEWQMVFQLEDGKAGRLGPRKFGAGLTSQILRTRQPILLRSLTEVEAIHQSLGIQPVGPIAKAWMGVPLIAAGNIVGAMIIQNYAQENVYTEQNLALFSTIAAQAAIAIQNARLFEETQRRVEQTQLLLRVGEAAASTLDSIEIMRRVAREATRALGADMAGAYLPDEAGKKLVPVTGYHVPPDLNEQFLKYNPPLEGNPFVEEAYKNKRIVFTSDLAGDTRLDAETRQLLQLLNTKTVLLTPMIVKDEVIGGLWLIWWQETHTLTDEEKQLVEGLVRQAAIAIQNARLLEQAQERAERELLVRTITDKVRRSASTEAILRTTLQELGHMLGASQSVIRLGPPEQLLRRAERSRREN